MQREVKDLNAPGAIAVDGGVSLALGGKSSDLCCSAAYKLLTFLHTAPLRVVGFCSHHVAVARAGPGRGAAWGV